MERAKIDTEELIKIPKLIKAISHLLSEIVKVNSQIEYDAHDPFSSKVVTTIPIQYYIERIKKYTNIENSTLIITLIYADRVCGMNSMVLHPHNIHRVILASCLLAIKYNEDEFYANDYYAQVGGITTEELNLLEYNCIQLLNFNLFVDKKIFQKYVNYLSNYPKI